MEQDDLLDDPIPEEEGDEEPVYELEATFEIDIPEPEDRHRRHRRHRGSAPGHRNLPTAETRNPIMNLEFGDYDDYLHMNDVHFDVNKNLKLHVKKDDNYRGRDVQFEVNLPQDLGGQGTQPHQQAPYF